MGLKEEYLARAVNPVYAAFLLAEDLMRGDPATFKAGYTADNAAISAAEIIELDAPQIQELCTALDADTETVLTCVAHAKSTP